MKRRLFVLFTVFLATAGGMESCAGEHKEHFLAEWTEYSSDDVYYGDLIFLTFYYENCGQKNIVIPESQGDYQAAYLRLHKAEGLLRGFPHCSTYSVLNDLLKPVDRPDASFLWRPGYDIHLEALGVSPNVYPYARAYYLQPGERHVQGFLPIWIPALDDLGGRNAVTLEAALQHGKQVFACFDARGVVCKPLTEEQERKLAFVDPLPYGFEEMGAYDWEDGIDVSRIGDNGYVSYADVQGQPLAELGLQVHTLTVRARPEEELQLLSEWYTLLPETCVHPELFNGAVFPRPSQFSLADLENNKGKTIELFKSRTSEVDKRIARHKELEKRLLERASMKNSTISCQMKDFIVIRGYLIDIKYAQSKKESLNIYMELLDYVLQSEDRELWTRYLKWIVLRGAEEKRTDVVPNETVDLFSRILAFRNVPSESTIRGQQPR